ncbi:MAG TPA: T9SS type A sorting domain-containing protein, partial [Candidatus Kapabacteria bacterium]|nr:T9SS type A sorting domain-containing protein [Candidatus Kapabacteria bacterium]
QWGTVIAVNTSDSVATISIKILSAPITDTLALVYYKTLIGTTLTPDVTLPSATTTNGCTTVSAVGSAIIKLLPPGCELGTLSFNTSGLSMKPPFPNPTNGNAAIVYSTGETAKVNIFVTDALGRTILTLVDAMQKPGMYYAAFDIRDLPGGIYFVRMREGEYTSTEKLFLVR